ncbi:MAG: hypothetical protein ACRD3C_02920 [Vicinamibacterales bacterium]
MKRTATLAATSSEAPTLITFRDGFTANCAVLAKLLDIEARGCTCELLADGRICIRPPGQITADEITFLREHRDEARRVLQYQADDSHLFKT